MAKNQLTSSIPATKLGNVNITVSVAAKSESDVSANVLAIILFMRLSPEIASYFNC
jgi:hypothetical protein